MTKSSIFKYIVATAVILATVRGGLVYHFNFQADIVYQATSISILFLSLYSFVFKQNSATQIPKQYKHLIVFNAFLYMLYEVINMSHGIQLEISDVYRFIPPMLVYSLVNLEKALFQKIFGFITIAVATSVIIYFSISLSNGGEYKIYEINRVLRPDFTDLDRMGNLIRQGGYLGSNHDAANVLGMVGLFYLSKSLKQSIKYVPLFCLSISALMLTFSASNITIFLFLAVIIMLVNAHLTPGKLVASIVAVAFVVAVLIENYGGTVFAFTDKFGEGTNAHALLGGLTLEYIQKDWLGIILGYKALFGWSIPYVTEVGYIKILFELGVMHFIVFVMVLFFPILNAYITHRNHANINKVESYQYYIFPVIFGLLSLLHYGSVLRVTSVFVFYLFVAGIFRVSYARKYQIKTYQCIEQGRDMEMFATSK